MSQITPIDYEEVEILESLLSESNRLTFILLVISWAWLFTISTITIWNTVNFGALDDPFLLDSFLVIASVFLVIMSVPLVITSIPLAGMLVTWMLRMILNSGRVVEAGRTRIFLVSGLIALLWGGMFGLIALGVGLFVGTLAFSTIENLDNISNFVADSSAEITIFAEQIRELEGLLTVSISQDSNADLLAQHPLLIAVYLFSIVALGVFFVVLLVLWFTHFQILSSSVGVLISYFSDTHLEQPVGDPVEAREPKVIE